MLSLFLIETYCIFQDFVLQLVTKLCDNTGSVCHVCRKRELKYSITSCSAVSLLAEKIHKSIEYCSFHSNGNSDREWVVVMGGGGWRGIQGAWTMEQEMRGRVSEDKDFLSLSLSCSLLHARSSCSSLTRWRDNNTVRVIIIPSPSVISSERMDLKILIRCWNGLSASLCCHSWRGRGGAKDRQRSPDEGTSQQPAFSQRSRLSCTVPL